MSLARCEDDQMLQRFVDEELSPDAAEIMLDHVEKCGACAQRLQNLKLVKAFCREQLGREDEQESEFAENALLRVRSRLDIRKAPAEPQGHGPVGRIAAFFDRLRLNFAELSASLRWRMITVPVAFAVLVGLVVWFGISPSTSISADEVLSESDRRTSLWETQPNKVLYWGYETTFINHPTLPDGKYSSRHWQYNLDGQGLRLNRLYDANGALVSASARRPDGSYIYYSPSLGEKFTVTPSRDELLSYAATLDAESRRVLENSVRSDDQAWQIGTERDLEIKRKLTTGSERRTVQIMQTGDYGRVFRVRQVIFTGKDIDIRMEIDDDIAADSFRRIHGHHVNYHPDGKITTTDSQLKFYEDSTIEDFNAHDLSAEVAHGKNIVRVTPKEVLKDALRYEAEKKNRQQQK